MEYAQFQPNGLERRFHVRSGVTPLNGVWQDKPHSTSARVASTQPAPDTKNVRAQQLNTAKPRLKNLSNNTRHLEKVTSWVKPVVKAELQRKAREEGLSLSKTAGAFLEKAIQVDIDMQYGALLQPVIKETIRKEMATLGNRLAFLLIRVGFSAEQTRIIVATILGRMPERPTMSTETLNTLLDQSRAAAKRKLSYKDPSLSEIITQLEEALEKGGEA